MSKKKITVSQRSSAETDIYLAMLSSKEEFAGAPSSVEIVTEKGKTSNYTVVSGNTYHEVYRSLNKKTYYAGGGFYLQPKSVLNKAETVKLKVNYDGTKARKGKEYCTYLTVNIKPVKKYSIKQYKKAKLCKNYVSGDAAQNEGKVVIQTKPEYFKGAKLVVTKLNGKEVPEEVDSKYAYSEDGEDGWYYVDLSTKEGTAKLGKSLSFGVTWVDENGKTLEGTKITPMKVALYSDSTKLETTKAEITVQPDKIYKKLVFDKDGDLDWVKTNDSRVVYTAPVKISGKNGDWRMESYFDNLFEITYKKGKIQLVANRDVIGGTSYTIPLTFINDNTEECQVVTLTVKVADVTSVKSSFDTKSITLYEKAPYMMDMVATALYSGNEGIQTITSPKLGAGLTEITKVEIEGTNSPYEIYEYQAFDNEGNYNQVKQYGITFKDKKFPKNATAKDLKNVNVKITYGNGIKDDYISTTVKLNVNVVKEGAKKK